MRLVGNGLGRSLGSCCSLPSSHTRLLSLRKGKERVRDALGERSGVPEGDVRLGSAMTARRGPAPRQMLLLLSPKADSAGASVGWWVGGGPSGRIEVSRVTSGLSGEKCCEGRGHRERTGVRDSRGGGQEL